MSACSSAGGTRPSLLRSIDPKKPGPIPQMPGAAFVGISISPGSMAPLLLRSTMSPGMCG